MHEPTPPTAALSPEELEELVDVVTMIVGAHADEMRPMTEQQRWTFLLARIREYSDRRAVMPPASAILTVRQAALELDVDVDEAYRMIESDQLPAFQVSGRWFVRREDLER